MRERYSIRIAWSDVDQCFIAAVPEFPKLLAHGDTRDEALSEIEDALKTAFDWRIENGEQIPQPELFQLPNQKELGKL